MALLINAENQAGSETAVAASEHAVIHGGEDFAGTLRVVEESADDADEERDSHGGGHAFAADVADNHEYAVVPGGDDLEEVSANVACGKVGAVEFEPGDLGDLAGDKVLLHVTRVAHLLRDCGLAAAVLDDVVV